MADSFVGIKIKDLPEAQQGNLTDNSVAVVDDGATTRKTKLSTFAEWLNSKLGIGKIKEDINSLNSTMIKSEEISYQDVLADVNQPVLLKDFSIDSKWKTRKIIGILPVSIRGYDTSLFIPSIYRQYSKAFFTSNIKQSYDITINVLYK